MSDGASASGDETPECDAVFRGGITSGVIYPGAVATLAKHYRLRSIGGGSAGAIAAGVAAAAEYGRSTGTVPDAFDRLKAIADDVSGGARSRTSLTKLFRPIPSLRWLYDLGMLWIDGKRRDAIARLLKPALLWTGAGAAASFVLLLLLAGPGSIGAWLLALGWSLAVAMLIAAACAIQLGRRLHRAIFVQLPKEGYFGFCSGTNESLGDRQDLETLRSEGALMDWMHATVQDLSGRVTGAVPEGPGPENETLPLEQRPLCMRDLWQKEAPQEWRIRLSLSTTNLTQQLPYQFPFLERDQGDLFFLPSELARVLPRDIVRWMVRQSRPLPKRVAGLNAPDGLRRLPLPGNLPVLFGVRLSLSFPGLLSAVPLWAVDEPDHAPKRLVRCWFSDGGITSNFPISAFDSALPTRPTFGFDLRAATPEQEAAPRDPNPRPGYSPDPMVVVAGNNADGMPPRAISDIGESLPAFVSSIVATARNSRENELMLMPGYRDRIVHIAQSSTEGGLNLGMSDTTITNLSDRGSTAAQVLVERFHPKLRKALLPPDFAMDWPNHRWVRYRTFMTAAEGMLAAFRRGADGLPANPASYAWSPASVVPRSEAAREEMLRLAERFEALAREQAAEADDEAPSLFDRVKTGGGRKRGNSPRPRMALALQPAGRDPAKTLPYR